MREQMIQVVEQYIDAVRHNDARSSPSSRCRLRIPDQHIPRRSIVSERTR